MPPRFPRPPRNFVLPSAIPAAISASRRSAHLGELPSFDPAVQRENSGLKPTTFASSTGHATSPRASGGGSRSRSGFAGTEPLRWLGHHGQRRPKPEARAAQQVRTPFAAHSCLLVFLRILTGKRQRRPSSSVFDSLLTFFSCLYAHQHYYFSHPRYRRFRLQQALEGHSDIMWCPALGCGAPLVKKKKRQGASSRNGRSGNTASSSSSNSSTSGGRRLTCGACGQVACGDCGRAYHGAAPLFGLFTWGNDAHGTSCEQVLKNMGLHLHSHSHSHSHGGECEMEEKDQSWLKGLRIINRRDALLVHITGTCVYRC